MASDLHRLPVSGITVRMCGDAHVENLGAYAAPGGQIVFDLNDFDESFPGPWEWDVKRLATSIILAGDDAHASKSDCQDAARTFIEAYRRSMAEFARMSALELAHVRVGRHTKNRALTLVFAQAERATTAVALDQLTVRAKNGNRRFHDKRPTFWHISEKIFNNVIYSLKQYRDTISPGYQQVLDHYRPIDVAFKVVGTGSVGTCNYVVYLTGHSPDDALFLQVKEALPSCHSTFLKSASLPAHQGRRVAEAQQKMQTFADPFIGWTTIGKNEFLVRQLSDHKASVGKKQLHGKALVEYARVCGEVMAKGHARTGDAAAIWGYCGSGPKLDRAITAFALSYAHQTKIDHDLFVKAITMGTITAKKG